MHGAVVILDLSSQALAVLPTGRLVTAVAVRPSASSEFLS